MAGPLGKLTAVLGLDAREFESGIKSAQTSLGGFGVSASSAAKAAGVAVAGGFALMSKGALEAQAAQGKFMAATGASREEAKLFVSSMDGLAGSAGAVGKSFDEISAVGTMVAQQFGTTGAETARLTESILEFSKVTGQDATAAAGALEDTLSTFGLTGADAVGVMDKLVASSQKYGTDAGPAAVQALNDMAPALTAMGMGIDDGIELLNAFEVAGVDAGSAASGLNKAIKTLEPGQSLDDLIAQVASIEDPILKAQTAAKIFGKSAGPDMARLIQPGMTSLDDFGISADEAAGSVNTAAEGMLTDADKIRSAFDKLGAGARELGQQFGPALTGLASLGTLASTMGGPKIVGSFIDGIKTLTAKVLPTAVAQGTVVGAAMAEGEAEGAAGASAISKIGARIAAMSIPLAASGTTVGSAVGSAMALGVSAGWLALIGAGAGAALFGPRIILEHLTGTDMTSKLAQAGAEMAEKFATSYSAEVKATYGQTFVAAYQAAIAAGQSEQVSAQAGKDAADAFLASLSTTIVDHTADDAREAMSQSGIATIFANDQALASAGVVAGTTMGEAVVPAYIAAQTAEAERNKNSLSLWGLVLAEQQRRTAEAKQVFADSARAITANFADALRGSKDSVKSAMSDLTYVITHPLQGLKEVARVEGALTSEKLQKALASKNPDIKTQAEQTQARLIAIWEELTGKVYTAGDNTSDALENSLNNGYPGALGDAREFVRNINAIFASLSGKVGLNIQVKGDEQYGHGHSYASGGYVAPGTINTVGEEGIERLTMFPGGGAFVTPMSSGNTSDGGTRSVTININGGDTQTVKQTVLETLDQVIRAANPRTRFTTRTAS